RANVAQAFDWYSYPFQNPEEHASAYAEFRKDFEGTNHGRRAIGVYPGGGAFYGFLLRRDADLEGMLPAVSGGLGGLRGGRGAAAEVQGLLAEIIERDCDLSGGRARYGASGRAQRQVIRVRVDRR